MGQLLLRRSISYVLNLLLVFLYLLCSTCQLLNLPFWPKSIAVSHLLQITALLAALFPSMLHIGVPKAAS